MEHRRVYRIYRDLELNFRIKPRRRLHREKPESIFPYLLIPGEATHPFRDIVAPRFRETVAY